MEDLTRLSSGVKVGAVSSIARSFTVSGQYQRMPPIYELSSPLFFHSKQDGAEKIQNVGGKIIDISVDNGEAGMYFAVRSTEGRDNNVVASFFNYSLYQY